MSPSNSTPTSSGSPPAAEPKQSDPRPLHAALDAAVNGPEAAARHWYRLLVGDRRPQTPIDPHEEERSRQLLQRIYPDNPQRVEAELLAMRSRSFDHAEAHCWGPNWRYLIEALAAHCGRSPAQVDGMTFEEIAADFKAAYERKQAAAPKSAAQPTNANGMQRPDTMEAATCSPADGATMPPRHPRLKLPEFFPWAVGVVIDHAGAADPAPLVREEGEALAALSAELLRFARVLADSTTPRSARHALVIFRPALDALADYLTRWFGGHDGVVQPPCNYPMEMQSAVMRLAEAVQAAQDWEAASSDDILAGVLPTRIVDTLESVIADLHPAGVTTKSARNGTAEGEGSTDATLPELLSAPSIARRLNLTDNAVDSFLRRLRRKLPDCYAEVNNPRMNEPRILYRVADVWPYLQAWLSRRLT